MNGGRGWGSQEAKVCVEFVDVDLGEPQLGKMKLEEGCASATDEETSPPPSKIPSDLIWPSSRPRRACRPQPTMESSVKKKKKTKTSSAAIYTLLPPHLSEATSSDR